METIENHNISVRYFRITPGENGFLWEENVRDQNIRFDMYYDVTHNAMEQWNFCHLQIGDIIITHWENLYILGIGRVCGPFKRIMRYRYYKQTVPVEWFDIQPRAIPSGEKLTTSWSEKMIQEISESEFNLLMDVSLVTDNRIVKEHFNLHLKKAYSVIVKDQQEDKICDLIEQGKVDNALELVTTENMDMITDYAQDYLALKNYPLASQFYAKVIAMDPGNLGALNNQAFIRLETGKYEEAIAYANRVLNVNPEYGCSWLNKGNALMKLGRVEEATECFDKVMEIDSRNKLNYP